MKKNLLIAAAAIASLQVANASKSFDGFYLGAQAALNSSKTKGSITDASMVTGINSVGGSTSGNKRANGFLYGLYAGYGKNLNGLYVGGELSISGDATKHKATAANYVRNTVTTQKNAQYKRGVILGLAPRFGYVFGENLAYIKTGIEISRDKASLTSVSTSSGGTTSLPTLNANKTAVVFTPGVGYERAIGNLLLRAEYTYNAGKKMIINNNTSPVTNYAQVSYSDNRFALGLAYKF
jgi:hypothetical protein